MPPQQGAKPLPEAVHLSRAPLPELVRVCAHRAKFSSTSPRRLSRLCHQDCTTYVPRSGPAIRHRARALTSAVFPHSELSLEQSLVQVPLNLRVNVSLCHPLENHRMVGVGRDLCGSPSPTLLPKQGHLQ